MSSRDKKIATTDADDAAAANDDDDDVACSWWWWLNNNSDANSCKTFLGWLFEENWKHIVITSNAEIDTPGVVR